MEIHYCTINTHLHVRRTPRITSSEHSQLNLKSFKLCTSLLWQWLDIYIYIYCWSKSYMSMTRMWKCVGQIKILSNIIHSNVHSNLVKLCSPKQYISWLINVNRHMNQSIWICTYTHTWPFKRIKQSICELGLCGMLCSTNKRNIKSNQRELLSSTRQAPGTNLVATK